MKTGLSYGFLLFFLPGLAWSATRSVIITDQNGEVIENAVVILPDRNTTHSRIPKNYTMDQVNKQFLPQVLVIPQNNTVNFPNSDDTRHHVYSFSKAKTFELRLYHGDEAAPVFFDKPGLIKIGCNIHDNMRAYIIVTEHSVYGLTNNQGLYLWPPLDKPVDKIEVWHPLLDETLTVEIDQTATETVEISLPIVPIALPPSEQPSSLEDRLKRFKRNAQ